jgi:hypothetical protein
MMEKWIPPIYSTDSKRESLFRSLTLSVLFEIVDALALRLLVLLPQRCWRQSYCLENSKSGPQQEQHTCLIGQSS